MKTREPTENIDYVFIYPEESQTFIDIKLISGKYSGIIYRYGKVGVREEGDAGYLQFEYDIIFSPFEEHETQTKEFKNHIGDILVNIMLGGDDNEIGNNYIEGFSL